MASELLLRGIFAIEDVLKSSIRYILKSAEKSLNNIFKEEDLKLGRFEIISSLVIAIFLILFNVGNSIIFIQIFAALALIYVTVRCYLENEAMSKAIYVANEYMQDYKKENENIKDEDISTLTQNFELLNKIGIPLTNFYLISICLIKIIILAILAII